MEIEDDEMYQLICKGRFDAADKQRAEIISLLKGNGNQPGLCERVRRNTRNCRAIIGAGVFVITIGCVEMIRLIYHLIRE